MGFGWANRPPLCSTAKIEPRKFEDACHLPFRIRWTYASSFDPLSGSLIVIRRRIFLALALALPFGLVSLTGCESSTDLGNTSIGGRWDGTGALQERFPEVRLELSEGADGAITGTWRRGSSAGPAQGTNQGGQIVLQLQSFELGTVTFQGRFTNRYRLEGDLQGAGLGAPATFRRIRF
jgi:hypothetical protein